MNLVVDVISDVICPWCFIGKRRLSNAISSLGDDAEIQVRWHPFQLNPTMPAEGITRREYRTRKFGSWERSQALDANVTAVGAAEGVSFSFDRVERTPNTVNAHRVIWLAGQRGAQDAVVESLFMAYFSHGLDIGDPKTLAQLAADAGLKRPDVERLLNSDDGMEEIAAGKAFSRQHNVSSVPFFIVNDEVLLSGAQPPETFLKAFKLAGGSTAGSPPGEVQ